MISPKILFALIVFLGSFLLFVMEPLTGKIITPKFGGTAAVWTTCLFFYQFIVLCGYALTYWLAKSSVRTNLKIYVAMFAVSLLWSCLPGQDAWNPGEGNPVAQLLFLFVQHVAAPALMLSSISGTMQVWYRWAGLGNPYPLYSVSNTGSLLALLAYPLAIEPQLTVNNTLNVWTGGYVLLALLVLVAAWSLRKTTPVEDFTPPAADDSPGAQSARTDSLNIIKWTGLSTLGSLILSTQTAYMTTDIAPVPLLWVAPLAMYLLTFILVFASPRFYLPMLCTHLWPLLAIIEMSMGDADIALRAGVSVINVFLLCMICHGELAASRPEPRRLPLFYLCMSIGGMLGGLIVSVAGPLLFNFDLERHLTITIMVALTLWLIVKRKLFPLGYRPFSYTLVGGSCAALLVLLGAMALPTPDLVHRERNFYGCIQIKKHATRKGLFNGQILHGEQSIEKGMERVPLSYYRLTVQLLDLYLRLQNGGRPLNFAVVGLGIGTMASYGLPGDHIDFLEIDPKIVKVAKEYFTYVPDSTAQVNILMGDGRRTMQDMPADKKYDLLMVDAFNADAIPIHLLTLEAVKIFMSHVSDDGILLYHLSNRYVKLAPPVGGAAIAAGLTPTLITEAGATWMVLSRKKDTGDKIAQTAAMYHLKTNPHFGNEADFSQVRFFRVPKNETMLWTDDFANLASAFRYKGSI